MASNKKSTQQNNSNSTRTAFNPATDISADARYIAAAILAAGQAAKATMTLSPEHYSSFANELEPAFFENHTAEKTAGPGSATPSVNN